MRERAPVMHDDQFNRWYLTRFDDVRQILRDKDMSADPRKANPASYIAKIAALTGMTQSGSTGVSMLFMDDPDHRRVRGLVNKAFTLKAVEALRPRVREIATGLLAQIEGTEFDLMTSFAGVLPVIVIAEMLGIDPADRDSSGAGPRSASRRSSIRFARRSRAKRPCRRSRSSTIISRE